ncbi:PQQ-dependent sugar dehydrogenase [Aeoliella sp. SH292]|uniref:PQQ-dependent sugar dehydrogenase n=1 Tax=Aeoliella sp. SH292 TaxID=3454464 RepID=UPI003F991060
MSLLQRRRLRIESLETRIYLAGDTYLVNFQNDEATTPIRYLRDQGLVFGPRGDGFEYGWSVDHAAQGAERSANLDQRLDTLIQVQAGQNWEFALANGNYQVTVAVGDPANNDGVHTLNVEGVNYWTAAPDVATPLIKTMDVTVSDGRLTLDVGAAANLATRINYLQIVGIPSTPNSGPVPPTITEPSTEGQSVNPADVHMEAIGFFDLDGNTHKSTDWEIWTTGAQPQVVWQTLGIEGVERLHTHLGDGIFMNAQAGEFSLAENTSYQLRVRFRDDTGAVSDFAIRNFVTGNESAIFPMKAQDILTLPGPQWVDLAGVPIELQDKSGIITPGDFIRAIDTDGGSNSPAEEGAANAIDGTLDKYLNFGKANSGFIVTPSSGASIVTSFRITTANDVEGRDPSAWSLFGTNDAITSANNSTGNNEAWVLIDSGSLALPADRETPGDSVEVTNSTAYTSYRMVFTGLKDAPAVNSMQIAEIQFFGDVVVPEDGTLLANDDDIRAIDLDGNSGSPDNGNEDVEFAIDGSLDKYLNFGKENSGFIVTPGGGKSIITGFQITTANDDADRDPRGWQIFGTNDAITSAEHSTGTNESWTLIASGTNMNLPTNRNTLGPEVTFTNTVEYSSYRMVFTSLRNSGGANSMQIGEVQFFGDFTDNEPTPFVPPSLVVESGATGDDMLRIEGSELVGNAVIDSPPLASDADLRVVITAGSDPLSLPATNLVFTDNLGIERTVFLPAIELAAGGVSYLWVSIAGGTYYGQAGQTTPDFSVVARDSAIPIPFVVNQSNFVIERVGTDYRLPVNIAFVENPGPNPDDPLYYVSELYGSIQVVTRDGTKHEFATGLLDYNPTGAISGSGEQGLTGITVVRDELDPEIYHLYVTLLWDNGAPAGNQTHYPKVERITSVAGGLTLASRTVLLNMQPETQGQSHQISNISIGPDGLLYVHMGDGFNAGTALNLTQFRGKILRMNLDGSAPTDNPLYDAGDGITATDYIFAYGLRNPFGGRWRGLDDKLYFVENGPSVDRLAQVNAGVSYGWNGSDASMATNAIYNWNPSTAPVNLAFIEPETFAGSMFPADMMDHLFVSQSGATYATGPQGQGKRITEFVLDENGALVSGPESFVQYVGTGKFSVVAIAAGPDGLYFSTLYEDSGAAGPTAAGAELFRIRYINPLTGDYNIDGVVDQADYAVWKSSFGSNLLLAADGNKDGVVNLADYTVWRDNLGATLAPPIVGTMTGTPAAVASTIDSGSSTTSTTSDSLLKDASPNSTSDVGWPDGPIDTLHVGSDSAGDETSSATLAREVSLNSHGHVDDYFAADSAEDADEFGGWLDDLAGEVANAYESSTLGESLLEVEWNTL